MKRARISEEEDKEKEEKKRYFEVELERARKDHTRLSFPWFLGRKQYHVPDICIAAEYGSDLLVEYLVKERKENVNAIDYNGTTALMLSVRSEGESNMRMLLKLGADMDMIDNGGGSALGHTIMGNEIGAAKMLVEHGVKIPDDTIDFAKDRGSPEMVRYLENVLMEQLFSTIVTGGILSEGEFREFLANGVCDARILIHIANFAYRSEKSESKRVNL